MKTHINVSHLGQKEFVCIQCDARYGYKRLLQRHLARQHGQTSDGSDEAGSSSDDGDEPGQEKMDIDTITGYAYSKRSEANRQKVLRCPYPDVAQITPEKVVNEVEGFRHCDYVFTRAYDLRRHLLAVHGIEIDKEAMDRWAEKNRGT